jgi:hypothetical protein
VGVDGVDAAIEALRAIADPDTDAAAHQGIARNALQRLNGQLRVKLWIEAPRSLKISRP